MTERRGLCRNCNKPKNIHTKDGLCNWCYRKIKWKPQLIKCKRCERLMKHQAKGFCPGCYNSLFHIDKVKLHNAKNTIT